MSDFSILKEEMKAAQRRGDIEEQRRIDRAMHAIRKEEKDDEARTCFQAGLAWLEARQYIDAKDGYLIEVADGVYDYYRITDLYDRDIREVVPERLVLEATGPELHEARFADTAQRDRIIPPGTPRMQWEEIYSPDRPPTVGGEYQGGFGGRGEILVGRIVKVGAHWSDQEKGRSGWHAIVEYPYVPARTRRE